MNRKLHQCPICKEWFNTTFAVMIEHYKLKHEFLANKTFKIAELTINMAIEDAKARFTPFPESMQHYVAARLIEDHIFKVRCMTPPHLHVAYPHYYVCEQVKNDAP